MTLRTLSLSLALSFPSCVLMTLPAAYTPCVYMRALCLRDPLFAGMNSESVLLKHEICYVLGALGLAFPRFFTLVTHVIDQFRSLHAHPHRPLIACFPFTFVAIIF